MNNRPSTLLEAVIVIGVLAFLVASFIGERDYAIDRQVSQMLTAPE